MELTAGVKKRKLAGWNVVATSAPKPVVVEEAPVVETPLSWTTLVDVHEKVFGTKFRWHQVTEGAGDITENERVTLLETALGDLFVNVKNVRALVPSLNKRNSQGWSLSRSFGVLVRVGEEWLRSQGVAPELEKKPDDGFKRGIVDPEAAVARVIAAGFTPNTPTIHDPERILQVALGGIPLDAKSVDQIWLSLGYAFVERWNRELPPLARKIQTAICHFANPRHIQIHTPAIFSFADDLAFRS